MSQTLQGFTILRNGLKYDYPFRESIAGLRALCGSVVVAVGKSEDGTEAAVAELGVEVVPTVWDESKRQGGVILSEQTNVALDAARRLGRATWGFYLQADEAISERDFDLIRTDLARAEAEGCDCVSFRYLHFWQSYERIAVGRRWYPQEIRCVRLDSAIESYGDAQSFRGFRKRFESEAVVYHYGHVREAAAYERKKKDFHRWWHPDAELARVIARGEKGDRTEETVPYLGPHPASMASRIASQGGLSAHQRRRVAVLGDPAGYSPAFLARVEADLRWVAREKKLFEEKPGDVVLLEPVSPLTFLLSLGKLRSRVPRSMASPEARPWTKEFQALLRFSERGVRVR
jgi:hypothetical protein